MMDSTKPPMNFAPPGHYYSPHPNLDEVEARSRELFGICPENLAGIDLNPAAQLDLLDKFATHHAALPWSENHRPPLRYYYDNHFFCCGDAVVLFCLLRHFRPLQIIEVGSGFSTALMLDTVERFGLSPCRVISIEPHPERLRSLLRDVETPAFHLREQKLEDVEHALFESLNDGDVLFVDSSHVSKVGSDVNRLVFEILPRLKPGVIVHFHDIFFPFEYPKDWILQGRAWNEAYLLRAFLQYNSEFSILFFNSYLHRVHRTVISQKLPLTTRNPGGSLWLRKAP